VPAIAVAAELLTGEHRGISTLPAPPPRERKPVPFATTPIALGAVLDGRYRIGRELGRGGMSIVHLAQDLRLHNQVAVKVLGEQVLLNRGRKWIVERFKQETEVMARINSPGVVSALDVGELHDGRPYLVMQYVPGQDLRKALAAGKMELARAGRLTQQLGQALAAVHELNVVHRDLKPENILLQQAGGAEHAWIVDFGIAKVLALADEQKTIVVGTPGYMAAEQIDGNPSKASDIYALGVIAYEMVTGQRPFATSELRDLKEAQRASAFPKPRQLRPDLPPAAEVAILKALSFDQQGRYGSAQEFGDALANAIREEPRPSPPPPPQRTAMKLVFAAVLPVFAFVIVWLLSQRPPAKKAPPSGPIWSANRFADTSADEGLIGGTIWRLPLGSDKSQPSNFLRRVDSNLPLTEGELVRLGVEVPRVGYAYAIEREGYDNGTLGKPYLIFPGETTPVDGNRTEPGKLIFIPALGDRIPYFTMRLGPNQVSEQLTIIVSPTRLEFTAHQEWLPSGDKMIGLDEAQVAQWEKQWGAPAEATETKGSQTQALTKAEMGAGQGTRGMPQIPVKLTPQDPAPQTVFQVRTAKPGEPILIKIPLPIKK